MGRQPASRVGLGVSQTEDETVVLSSCVIWGMLTNQPEPQLLSRNGKNKTNYCRKDASDDRSRGLE